MDASRVIAVSDKDIVYSKNVESVVLIITPAMLVFFISVLVLELSCMDEKLPFICTFIIGAATDIFLFCKMFKNKNLRKEINKYSKDAILVKAKINVDIYKDAISGRKNIFVIFKYKGEKCVYKLRLPERFILFKLGKDIDVYFSPTFDKIMLVKKAIYLK